ncbi:hypothetical protein [Hydrogenophaga sp. 5NK40-0174]|uniref:hypothetical protein n=1 Tax=Hydrogenophaga sp. 5NK40-0174 TaxID=3127649 RepID=UPI00310853CE
MFIRFSILARDTDSGSRTGILVAAHQLRDEGDLSVEEHEELRTCLVWFNENLAIPQVLKKAESRRAISWFKPNAVDAISKMWGLKRILELHGLHVEVLKSTHLGTVLYEDDWQVVAIPPKGHGY